MSVATDRRPLPNFYELLDVEPTASADEIKAAYRRLARQAHPDAGGNSGLFRLIDQAQATLTDPGKRAAYDRQRAEPVPPRAQPKPPPRTDDDGWRVEEEEPRYKPGARPWWAEPDKPEGLVDRLRMAWADRLPGGLGLSPARELVVPAAYGAGAGSAVAARIEVVRAIARRWPSIPILVHPQWWWIGPVVVIGALIGIPLSRGMAMRPWTSRVALLGGTWVALAAGEYVVVGALVLLMVAMMLRYVVRR